VQWVGLPIDDTSWEDWASLKEEYHLEDNVIFEGTGSDRLVNMHEAQHERP